MKLTTNDIIKALGDEWPALFPKGRKVWLVENVIPALAYPRLKTNIKAKYIPSAREYRVNQFYSEEKEDGTDLNVLLLGLDISADNIGECNIEDIGTKLFLFEDEAIEKANELRRGLRGRGRQLKVPGQEG